MSQPLVFWMACAPLPYPSLLNAIDRSIDDLAEQSFGFLERLIAAPSTVGQEAAAQRVVQAELDRLGFVTSATDVPEDIAADPVAGVPQASYAGRPNVVGHLTAGAGPSLLLNGHIDVVPAEDPGGGPRRRSSRSAGTAGCSAAAPAT